MLLLLTGFPPFFGWLVGAALLLWSPLWNARQKLLGLLVWPGGFSGLLFFALAMATDDPSSGSGGATVLGVAAEVLVVVAPIAVAVHLYRSAGRMRTVA